MSSDEKPRELPASLGVVLEEVRQLFSSKNEEYTSVEWYANFTAEQSRPVKINKLTPIEDCMVLCDKQDAAVWEHIFRGDTTTDLFRERLMDGLVYRLIALGMIREGQR